MKKKLPKTKDLQNKLSKPKRRRNKKSPKQETIIFEETLDEQNIHSSKLKGARSYFVGDIHPATVKFNTAKRSAVIKSRKAPLELSYNIYLPDKIILKPKKKYTLIIDYPFRRPFQKEFITPKNGLLLSEVVEIAVESYRKAYEEEDFSISKGLEGKYGIYGHDLHDLGLSAIYVKGDKIYLGVDS